jgi:hypothetical protein
VEKSGRAGHATLGALFADAEFLAHGLFFYDLRMPLNFL